MSQNQRTRSAKRAFRLCLLGASAALSTGCSTLQKGPSQDADGWSISKLWNKEYQRPHSIAVIWSPDVLTVPGKPATRGFGGRVFFYNEKSQAIPVDGDLIVHGYLGEAEDGMIQQHSDKTFAFTSEQLTSHFSPSQLGASYSIWIPWDDARGYQQPVNLIATFRTKEGGLVQGAPAKLMLPGKSTDSAGYGNGFAAQTVSFQQSSTPTNNGVRLPTSASHPEHQVATAAGSGKPKMRTTTIEIPKSASLAKPRAPQRLTLELGAAATEASAQLPPPQQLPSPQSSGGTAVGVGGPRESRTTTSDSTASQAQSVPAPVKPLELQSVDQQTLPASRVRSLPAPGSDVTFASPFAQKPLPKSDNFVRQASYFEQDSVQR